MRIARPTILLTLAVSAFGCRPYNVSAPPDGLPHSAATRSCGPADGPAVAIYLASSPVQALEPSAPYVRFYMWQALNDLAGRSFALTGEAPEGSAWYHRSVSDYEVATSGQISVTSVGSDNTIEGWVDVRFATAGRVRGGFRATWIPGQPLCG